MKLSPNLGFIAKVCLIIFSYIIIYYFFIGLTSKTYEGDSLNYHIPIAKAYVSGAVGNPYYIKGVPFLKYSPGASEDILALLMLAKIPINTYNVFGVLLLLIISFYAGKAFGLSKNFSIIFAVTIASLHGVVRWLNTQVIDIWLAVFFLLSLYLLQKPKKSIKYFLFIGFSLGMLVGSKFTGPIFFVILFVFYFANIYKYLNIKNVIAFFIPFTLFGLSWYIRNYLLTLDPIYPQSSFFFKGSSFTILNSNVWRAIFVFNNGFYKFFSAFLSEYSIWFVAILAPILVVFKNIRKHKNFAVVSKLMLLGLLNFLVFMFLPSDKYFSIMVSVFRYSYSALIPLILSLFILAKDYKKEELISVLALISLIVIPEVSYHPKLLLFFIPPSLIIYFYDKNIYAKLLNLKIQLFKKKK